MDMPHYMRKKIKFITVRTMDEVLSHAMVGRKGRRAG
jgi:predicted ATP-dependent protease